MSPPAQLAQHGRPQSQISLVVAFADRVTAARSFGQMKPRLVGCAGSPRTPNGVVLAGSYRGAAELRGTTIKPSGGYSSTPSVSSRSMSARRVDPFGAQRFEVPHFIPNAWSGPASPASKLLKMRSAWCWSASPIRSARVSRARARNSHGSDDRTVLTSILQEASSPSRDNATAAATRDREFPYSSSRVNS
jgi:hypothetical protein